MTIQQSGNEPELPDLDEFLLNLIAADGPGFLLDDDDIIDGSPTKAVPVRKNQVVLSNSHDDIDKDAKRKERMTRVIGKFATTLTLTPIDVKLSDSTPNEAASWSGDNSITFVDKFLGDMTDPAEVASIKGLGLHEIGHLMLTPQLSPKSKFIGTINSQDLRRAFNVLEDQRVESQLTSMFGNAGDWLAAATIKELARTEHEAIYQYPLIAGRSYLPDEVRQAYKDNFAWADDVATVEAIIDEYVGLNLSNPKTQARALELITQFNQWIVNQGGQKPQPSPDGSDCDYAWVDGSDNGWGYISDTQFHPTQSKSKDKDDKPKPVIGCGPLTDKQKQDAADRVKNQPKPKPKDKGDGDGDGQSGDTGEPGDNPGGKQAGTTGSTQEVLTNALNEILSRKAKDITNTLAQFNGEVGLDGRTVPTPPRVNKLYRTQLMPDAKSVAASKSFARELESIRAQYDPGWETHQESGRINVQRYMTGCEVDEAFDQWDIGREDAVDIETVILLDVSGSMWDRVTDAYQSMWAIKRALDKVGASTTVVSFNSLGDERTIYSPDESAGSKYVQAGCGGGTDPLQSLRYARSVLANSERAIKVLIVITDGEWSNAKASDDIIQEIGRANVLTALARIDAGDIERGDVHIDAHRCAVAVPINQMSDIVKLARALVRQGIKTNLVNG